MKVLVMIDSLHLGGAERLVNYFAKTAVKKQLLQLKIVVLRASYKNTVEKEIEFTGTEIFYFSSNEKNELLDFKRFIRIYKFVKNEEFDLIHTNLLYSNIIGGLIGFLLQVPFIATIHNEKSTYGNIKLFIEKIILLNAEKIFIVTKKILNIFPKIIQRKMIYMPNAIPIENFEMKEYKENKSKNSFRFIFVGRMAKVKRVDLLITAIEALKTEGYDVILDIVGDGSQFNKLKFFSSSLCLTEKEIVFHGIIGNVEKILQQADVFVMASEWEGLPLALLEAMAVGLPVIVTPVGEIPDFINKNSGILYPVGDVDSLINAMKKMIQNPDLRKKMGLLNRQMVEKKYSIDTWCDTLRSHYVEIERG